MMLLTSLVNDIYKNMMRSSGETIGFNNQISQATSVPEFVPLNCDFDLATRAKVFVTSSKGQLRFVKTDMRL